MSGKFPSTYGNSNLDLDDRLPPCPNCNGELQSRYIGNIHHKKISIRVKCIGCRIELTNSALKYDFVFLEDAHLKAWKRPETP